MFLTLLAAAAIGVTAPPQPDPAPVPQAPAPMTARPGVRAFECKRPDCLIMNLPDFQKLLDENSGLLAENMALRAELAKPKKCSVGVLDVLEPGRK